MLGRDGKCRETGDVSLCILGLAGLVKMWVAMGASPANQGKRIGGDFLVYCPSSGVELALTVPGGEEAGVDGRTRTASTLRPGQSDAAGLQGCRALAGGSGI